MALSKSEKNRRYRERHPEKMAAARKSWKERHPERNLEYLREMRRERPAVARAYDAVKYALRVGRLHREPCLFCGFEKVEAHHHDYAQPLAVTWLCKKHHALIHKEIPSRAADH